MNFLRNKQKDILILDLRTCSVKGALFNIKDGKRIVKKFCSKEFSKFGVFNGSTACLDTRDVKEQDFELGIVKKALGSLIKEMGLEKEIRKLPVYLTFPAEFFKARVFETAFKRETGQKKINRQEEKKICRHIFREAQKELWRQLKAEKAVVFDSPKPLKASVVSLKISGYKVASAIGCRGEDLNFKVLLIFTKKSYFNFIQDIIAFLRIKNFRFLHEVEVLLNCPQLLNEPNQLFVDIGEKNTRIFSFKGSLDFVEEFSSGDDDFLKAVAESFGITEQEAKGIKDNFERDVLSSQAAFKMEKILKPAIEQWTAQFKEALKGLDISGPKIVIFGQGSALKGLTEAIKTDPELCGFSTTRLKPEDLNLENQSGKKFFIQDIASLLLVCGDV